MADWTPFVTPAPLPGRLVLWLAIPLCVSVAIIHRTCRSNTLPGLWRRVAWLTAQIVVGLAALAVVAWLVVVLWSA